MAYNWTDQGGYLASAALSRDWQKKFQPKMVFRQFARAVADEFGRKKGATFNWDIYGDLATDGRALSETERMPETSIPITQGSLTVTEYGMSVPVTYKMEELSMLDVNSPVLTALKDNAAKKLDALVEAALDACNYRYTAGYGATTIGSWVATGTATTTANCNLNALHLREMVDKLKALNCPTINGSYFAMCTVKAASGLYASLEDTWKYTKYPVNGEIGKYYKARVMEETNAMDNTIGSSSVTGEAYVFGGDSVYDAPVIEAVVCPEEIRYKKGEDDYGRSKGMAWYYLGGFSLVHDNNPNNNVVKWDSAT